MGFYPVHPQHMTNCTHKYMVDLTATVINIPMLNFTSQQLLFVCIGDVFDRFI